MKKCYFCTIFIALVLLNKQSVAQTIDETSMVQNEKVPGYELLSDLTSIQAADRLLEKSKTYDLEIKASQLVIDLTSPGVELTAKSDWANEFVWKFGDGSSVSGFRLVSHKFEKAGKYQVEVVASNNEEIARKTIEVLVVDNRAPLLLEEMKQYYVFPHDNKLEANIQLDLPRRERKLSVEIQDISGNYLTTYPIGRVRKKQRIQIDLQNLENGKYYAILKGKKYSLVSKLIVAR